MDTIFDGEVPRARLALLLRHFSELKDNREPWRIVYSPRRGRAWPFCQQTVIPN
jgi:hypothetical protein